MDKRLKITIIVLIGLLLVAIALIAKFAHDNNERQKIIEASVVQMKQLQDGVARSESSYATKEDIEKFAKDSGVDLKPIQEDLDKLDAKIVGISRSSSITIGYTGANLPSSSSRPAPPQAPIACTNGTCQDEFGYRSNAQYFKLNEPFPNGTNVPWGQAGFSAWKKTPWDVKVLPRSYSVTTVVSRDDDGRSYFHHKFVITADGKKHTIPIAESKFIEEYPMASFHLDPALYMSVGAGAVFPARFDFTPSLQLSLLSYGTTKQNTTFSLLNFGMGYLVGSEKPAIIFTPIYYNIGEHFPLIENTYIGPQMSLDFSGGVGIFASIAVQL